MNANIRFALNVFVSGGFENLLLTIRAVNLSFLFTTLILSAFLAVPLLGILAYKISNHFSLKNPLNLKNKNLIFLMFFSIFILCSIDILCLKKQNTYILDNQKRLPLASNFIQKNKQIKIDAKISKFKNEKKSLEKITSIKPLSDRPNIFIFVVEALRGDYITNEIAPNLFEFKKENISFEKAFSSANNTPPAWYSIFHSNFPIYFPEANKNNKTGSLPLNILKKAGYKINVYASAEMTYFHMDNLLFGQSNNLVQNFNDFSSISKDPAIRDFEAIEKLKEDLKKDEFKESNIFLIFLDSTHSEYSWHKNFKPKFSPYLETINYITLSQSKKDLSLLQNRYKNAVGYIDDLFNKVITTLKEKDLYKDSIIVFSADHAEEFYEKKSLFHSSNLNEYQISIPIFYKLNSKKDVKRKLASQIDIFPSILDDLNITNFDSFFDGRSIFKETLNNYILSVGQNGVFFPKEFLFINENSLKIHGILSIKDSLLFEVIDSDDFSDDKVKNDLNKIFQSLEKDHLQDFN